MPITCDKKLVKNEDFTPVKGKHMPNVIQLMMCSVNIEILREWILQSISTLQVQYFDNQETVQIRLLRTQVMQLPHRRLLAVFFCLLNIDQSLKERVLIADDVKNKRKLVRFFMDLKCDAIQKFFSTEEISPSQFVDQCEELYVLS